MIIERNTTKLIIERTSENSCEIIVQTPTVINGDDYDAFIDLADVFETTYTGQKGKAVIVNEDETGLIFGEGGGGNVNSVNGVLPDENKNVVIGIGDISELTTQLASKISTAQKGIAGGVASLDENTKIPISQLPDISGNGKIAISQNDTLQDFLVNKIQPGSNITISIVNSGENESLMISATGGEGGSSVWGSITGTISNQSDLLAALNAKINTAEKGVANGVATLGSDNVIPLSQIPASLIGGLNLQGAWNALTNTPALLSGVGTKGYLYVVTVGNASITLDGITTVKSGDSVFFDGTVWQKISGQSVTVASVFGRIGEITAQTGDYTTNQVTESSDRKYVSSLEKTKLSNLSGANTGDETKLSIETKLGYSDKTISESFVFQSLYPDYGVITRSSNFKIDTIIAASGLTVTIKTSSDTNYTLGTTVAANDYLKVYGDVVGKSATLKGSTL